MNDLQSAIEAFYHAFSDQPKPKAIDACPCCVDSKNVCTLLSKAIRQLTPDELGPYSASAFLTSGDIPDYLYFLPRILEITISNEYWWPDPEVTGRAIADTNPSGWPDNRRIALDQLLASVLTSLMKRMNTGNRIDSWICAISKMGLDVAPFLELLEASPGHVVEFYENNSSSLRKGRLANAFWERPSVGHDRVREWFESPRISNIISTAYGL